MKTLYLVGNGFDIQHGIKTPYSEFRSFLEMHHEPFLTDFEAMYSIQPLDDTEPWCTEAAQERWKKSVLKDLWQTFEEEMGNPDVERMHDMASSLAEQMPEEGIKHMNLALKKYTNFECDEFEGVEQAVTIVKDQLEVLAQMFHGFNSKDFFEGSPTEQLACLNRAVEYVQLSEELETRFMAAVKRMKQAFNLCSSSEKISDEEKDYIHFYCAVRSILFKLTKGDAPDISQMNARVREMLEGAIQSDGIEELFETGKHISVDIFSNEYMDKINAIQLPNTKIKILQRLLSQAIDEFKKVNKIMGVEFADRLKRVVDEYNNRRRDESYANEVLDDIAGKLADLLAELKTEKDSFKKLGIDYEEKAFYDILKAVAKKYEFDNEYPDEKMLELSKKIKVIVDDKSRYTDWSTRDDIKANLQVDLILLLDEYGYPPVTLDDVYKEVLEQAENFKKYAG